MSKPVVNFLNDINGAKEGSRTPTEVNPQEPEAYHAPNKINDFNESLRTISKASRRGMVPIGMVHPICSYASGTAGMGAKSVSAAT